MNRRMMGALVGTTAAVTALATAGVATATPPQSSASVAPTNGSQLMAKSDTLPDAKADSQAALRKAAMDQVVSGKAKIKTINGKRVIEMAAPQDSSSVASKKGNKKGDLKNKNKGKKGKYVEYEPTQNASLFTILMEFGTKTKSPQGGTPGPAAGEIAQPDRTKDNSTYWLPKFDRAHYLDMMFGSGESMKSFYKAQSLGRYNLTGDVSNWVKLPYNEARYGHNPVAGDGTSESEGYWSMIGDGVTAWYNAEKAAGKTDTQITTYLAQFDKWDRFDYDGDGNFNEPDGYIDHFQAIHAGEGEEAGGGAQGADAVWSHRWSVQSGAGKTGPEANKAGGVQIGNTGIWVRDYTTEPENGGLGVFTHEYGHDLGLPDLYDSSNRSTNSTSFWSLMSGGSWLNHGKDAIGTTPGYMGAWEKIYLGWADLKTVSYAPGKKETVSTGPADLDDKKLPQAVAVTLPNKQITTNYNKPKSGSFEWWTGRGDNMSSSLTRDIDLTSATSASVSTAIQYDIEKDYDYLYGQVSTDGGTSWTDVGTPKTGKAMTTWGTASYDLTAYKGKKIKFRFLYVTDSGVNEAGAFLDDLTVTINGTATVDNVESATSAWTAKGGFERMGGSTTKELTHYYLAEYRRYSGYDKTLKTGPYNFGFANTKPDWVERFPFQDGLLITYVDNQYKDNRTAEHPGHGLVLPVDAHPVPLKWADGTLVSNRIAPFDATFGTQKTDALTLHRNSVPKFFPSQKAVKTFDDTNPNSYYFESSPYASTKVAGTGTKIIVRSQSSDKMKFDVKYSNN